MNEVDVNRVVIHEVFRDDQGRMRSNAGEVLGPDDESVIDLVRKVSNVYGKKDSRSYHGTFRSSGEVPFKDRFSQYAEITGSSDPQFLALTESASSLVASHSESTASKGGFIIYSEYSEVGRNYFLAVMVNNMPDVKIENLRPREVMRLDLSKIRHAMRISYEDYQEYSDSSEEDHRKELTYLSFIARTSGKTASIYFVTALGCEQQPSPKRATQIVLDETDRYFSESPTLRPSRKKFKDDLAEYLNSTKRATLNEVGEIIRRNLPPTTEDIDNKVNEIVDYLNGDECKVPYDFGVDKGEVSKNLLIKTASDGWVFEFKKSLIGTSPTSQIQYNSTHRQLIIRNLTPEVVRQIEKALEE